MNAMNMNMSSEEMIRELREFYHYETEDFFKKNLDGKSESEIRKFYVETLEEALTQHYEAAGFSDFYEKELKGKSEEEIRELYKETFPEEC